LITRAAEELRCMVFVNFADSHPPKLSVHIACRYQDQSFDALNLDVSPVVNTINLAEAQDGH
jgi:hypothetical protein